MYKIAICDDCREALREIEKLLRRYIEKNKIRAVVEAYQSQMQLLTELESGRYYDIIHFLRREMLDFTAFPVFFVSNLLLVQRKKYYFNRAMVSRNCSIVL